MKFMLTDEQYIHVIPELIENGSCGACAYCVIDYVDEKLGISIRFGYTELETFHGLFGFRNFDELLNNQLFFDNDKRRDPGFEYNQYRQGIIEDSDVMQNYFFEGNSYNGILPYYTSWFYNDKSGNIIFEISPYYPWFNVDNAESQSGFMTYVEFMKNYKVTIHKIIPRETLIQWNEQAKNDTHLFQDLNHDQNEHI